VDYESRKPSNCRGGNSTGHCVMQVYLALRRTDSPGLPGLFSKYTRWRLHTRYPHAGIAVDDLMYHSTMRDGLHVSFYKPDEWDLIPLKISAGDVTSHFKEADYDWFSLLSFILPFKARKRDWLYCYEWCWLCMTGQNPAMKVTPEMLLALSVGVDSWRET